MNEVVLTFSDKNPDNIPLSRHEGKDVFPKLDMGNKLVEIGDTWRGLLDDKGDYFEFLAKEKIQLRVVAFFSESSRVVQYIPLWRRLLKRKSKHPRYLNVTIRTDKDTEIVDLILDIEQYVKEDVDIPMVYDKINHEASKLISVKTIPYHLLEKRISMFVDCCNEIKEEESKAVDVWRNKMDELVQTTNMKVNKKRGVNPIETRPAKYDEYLAYAYLQNPNKIDYNIDDEELTIIRFSNGASVIVKNEKVDQTIEYFKKS